MNKKFDVMFFDFTKLNMYIRKFMTLSYFHLIFDKGNQKLCLDILKAIFSYNLFMWTAFFKGLPFLKIWDKIQIPSQMCDNAYFRVRIS